MWKMIEKKLVGYVDKQKNEIDCNQKNIFGNVIYQLVQGNGPIYSDGKITDIKYVLKSILSKDTDLINKRALLGRNSIWMSLLIVLQNVIRKLQVKGLNTPRQDKRYI